MAQPREAAAPASVVQPKNSFSGSRSCSPVNYDRAMKNRGRLLAWLQQIELVAHENDDVFNTK
jgi:hypothetical protein